MSSKFPQENPNPGARPVLSPPPPSRDDSAIEVNGFHFKKDEIVSVTIKRNGVEQTIYAPVDSKPVGFAG